MEADNTETGKQGNKPQPFTQTTSILNSEGQSIAWDLIEETARTIGIKATADKFKLPANTIHSRKKLHHWRKIPDGRSLTHQKVPDEQLSANPENLAKHIPGFRARVFKIADDSIRKFKPKSPKTFRELNVAAQIAERALGINEDTQSQVVLLHINEALESHEMPIEAHEVIPCLPDSSHQGISEPVAHQSESNAPKESNIPKSAQETSRTLNAGDNSRRQFVLPGITKSGKQ